jgi:hypothetical protein
MSLWFRNDVFSPATGLLSGGQAPRHVLDAQGVDVRLNEAAAQRDLVPDRRITSHLLFERANYPVERFGIDAEPTLRPLTIGRSKSIRLISAQRVRGRASATHQAGAAKSRSAST